METPRSIHQFWFGEALWEDGTDGQIQALEQNERRWWAKDPAQDKNIRRRFEPALQSAVAHERDNWRQTARGHLALVLLTDQFTRNMYRGTPRAFDYDVLARRWCAEAMAAGEDKSLVPVERAFLYMPLEHAEDPDDQERSVALFEGLAAEVGKDLQPYFDKFADFARRHRDIIARFGRFPHRNRVLGRLSTAQEKAFLKEPGSAF